MPQPWEQQPDETKKAYIAFIVYRDLFESRSLDEVCNRLYPKTQRGRKRAATGCVQLWSSKYRWVERVAAFDAERDRKKLEAADKFAASMAERHAAAAAMLQEKALQRLESLNPKELSANAVLAYLVEAQKLERIARGEAGEVTEQRGKVGIDVDLFATVDAIAERVRQRLRGGSAVGSVNGSNGQVQSLAAPAADQPPNAIP